MTTGPIPPAIIMTSPRSYTTQWDTIVRPTSSETNSGVFAIFVGMIARGAGIDTTIPRTLAFER